jgi:RNA ligase (TIGR02306 family)
MSDWNPQVVSIETVEHHRDADTLDVVTVLGDYPVIVKRDEYKVGDLAGYIPIDSIVPDTEQFYFLCPKAYEKYEDDYGVMQQRQLGPKFPLGEVPEKNRIIKAKKIRGTYSQGMLVRIPLFLNLDPTVHSVFNYLKGKSEYPGVVSFSQKDNETLNTLSKFDVGYSIVDLIGLKKWEEPEEENLPGLKKTRGANAEKSPVGWSIPHYDIDGIRKYIACLREDEEIVLTEKLHGSNAAFSHDGERLWVKSRNFYKKMDPEDMWWDIALRYDLEKKLSFFPHLVFFGEVYGQIKGFRYDTVIADGRLMTKIRFFDVYDLKKGRYLDYNDRARAIERADLEAVPQLYFGKWQGKELMYPFAEGKSMLNEKHIREGFVLNTRFERYEERLQSRMQVKLVGEAYNLQK